MIQMLTAHGFILSLSQSADSNSVLVTKVLFTYFQYVENKN